MKFAERYKTDTTSEVAGKWFDFGNGGKVLIARIGNPNYKEMMRAEFKPHDALRRSGREIPEDIRNEVLIRCMAHTIILGWEGFSGEGLEDLGLTMDGDKIPYTPDNAEKLLTEFKDFREEIAEIATNMENYLAGSHEAVVKN